MDMGGARLYSVLDVEVEMSRAVIENDARKALPVRIAGVVDLAIAVEGGGEG